ncbi:MAG: (2Fe-2S)-binding protein [Gammaproteobacteria bacterium]|nr:(2Fe-2S)-binding protein [Gammaproteobacteria bacterium]MDD9824346.1 (2Fe-2S)-binding protein [Gammaproteobacteria bacterium]MDD9863063.1 (2Fe-2S)-binding protein [Gammaproteobacteria bacterium]
MATFKINGKTRSVDEDADTPLLWVIRETLGMTGTKFGCGVASCGACTVYVNGKPERSCTLPLSAAEGADITTIEGAGGPAVAAVRDAWRELQVPQCGWCQSGQIMSAAALLKQNPKPDDQAIDARMSGNVCRCATYHRIRAAVHRAAEILEG